MQKGTTLIETVIYISILVVIFGIFTSLVLSVSKSYLQLSVERNRDMAAISVMERITREIRASSSADVSTPGVLVLGNTSFATTSSQNIQISVDNVDQGTLLPTGITVSRLIFDLVDSGRSKAVKMEMRLSGQTYYSTIILRGTYR